MCARTGRSFASFDTDPEVVATAHAVLAREEVPHRVVCRDGREALAEAGPVAFLYLDSSDGSTGVATRRSSAAGPWP
jgi:hypothetical protein